jgi:hypothetical protein
MKRIAFVGLTNKVGKQPLDDSTSTGKIISEITYGLGQEIESCRINLVQYAPVDSDGKLRYPNKEEIAEGALSLNAWISNNNPDVIVLLGKIVSDSVIFDNSISVEHPAYAIRNGRKKTYIDDVITKIRKYFGKELGG